MVETNTETELKRATNLLVRIICQRTLELEKCESFQAKELKELTGIIKDLASVDRALDGENDNSEIKVVFEGGDIKWAQ